MSIWERVGERERDRSRYLLLLKISAFSRLSDGANSTSCESVLLIFTHSLALLHVLFIPFFSHGNNNYPV